MRWARTGPTPGSVSSVATSAVLRGTSTVPVPAVPRPPLPRPGPVQPGPRRRHRRPRDPGPPVRAPAPAHRRRGPARGSPERGQRWASVHRPRRAASATRDPAASRRTPGRRTCPTTCTTTAAPGVPVTVGAPPRVTMPAPDVSSPRVPTMPLAVASAVTPTGAAPAVTPVGPAREPPPGATTLPPVVGGGPGHPEPEHRDRQKRHDDDTQDGGPAGLPSRPLQRDGHP